MSRELEARGAARLVEPGEAAAIWPGLLLPHDTLGCWESREAGHLSPRRLVAAQQLLAAKAGCEIQSCLATDLGRAGSGWQVSTEQA